MFLMTNHALVDDSLKEVHSLLHENLSNHENSIHPNPNFAHLSIALSSDATTSSTTSLQNALVTSPPAPLELRQNNPQDCSNLINASVDSATVEISRTTIALNTTFF
jgi:hypothetical protein